MPYIGSFTETSIQQAIDKAGAKLGVGESGMVVHLDDKGGMSVSIIHHFNDAISVEAACVMPASSDGFRFDPKKLEFEAELIARW